MEPVISKGGWHWDYYESLVKALTFLFLFHEPRFGLGGNCSHAIPRPTGSRAGSQSCEIITFQESSRLPCLAADWPPPQTETDDFSLKQEMVKRTPTTDFASQPALH